MVDPVSPGSPRTFCEIGRYRRSRSNDLILQTLELPRYRLDEDDGGPGRSKREIEDPEGISVGADGGGLRVVHAEPRVGEEGGVRGHVVTGGSPLTPPSSPTTRKLMNDTKIAPTNAAISPSGSHFVGPGRREGSSRTGATPTSDPGIAARAVSGAIGGYHRRRRTRSPAHGYGFRFRYRNSDYGVTGRDPSARSLTLPRSG